MALFSLYLADLFSVTTDQGLALSVIAAFALSLLGLLGLAGIIAKLTTK